MINWFSVAIIPLGIVIGTEIARTRMQAKGELYSFQPIWQHRALLTVTAISTVLFVEAARVSLADPTRIHLWTLIASSVAIQLSLLFSLAGEFTHAKKQQGSMKSAIQTHKR